MVVRLVFKMRNLSPPEFGYLPNRPQCPIFAKQWGHKEGKAVSRAWRTIVQLRDRLTHEKAAVKKKKEKKKKRQRSKGCTLSAKRLISDC